MKWSGHLGTGYYARLLEKPGFLKEEDLEPDLGPFQYYIDTFDELSTSRQIGMGQGPIPFTAIIDYFRIYPIGDFEDFRYLMRRLDSAFIEHQSKVTDKTKAK